MKPKYNELTKFASALGIKLDIGTPKGPFIISFEVNKGNKIAKCELSTYTLFNHPLRARELMAKRFAHEIAHYLVAPKHRRNKKDFGMSVSDSKLDRFPIEEVKAQLVEEYILNFFKIPYNEWMVFDYLSKKESMKNFPQAKKWWDKIGKKKISILMNKFSKTKNIPYGSL